jgi:SpoVK/Ycf46/Vps4 family AAA+-type ATPase
METTENLLTQIEKISSDAAKCNLDFNKLISIQDDINKISEFLEITATQVVLFACLVELSLQKTVTLEFLGKHFRCSILKLINHIHEFDVLESKKYIRKYHRSLGKKYSYNDIGYSVPHNVIESLRTIDKSKLNEVTILTLPNFLEQISRLINEREENIISTKFLLLQVDFMVEIHRKDNFINFIEGNVRSTVNKCIVFATAYRRLQKNFSIDIDAIISNIFDDFSEQMEFTNQWSVLNNELFKKDIIKFEESTFGNERTIGLTSRTIGVLYKMYPELYLEEEAKDGILRSTTIKIKKLYFDDGLKKQIDCVTNILSKKNFTEFQSRLYNSNLPKGITAIFYGQSGTGKTETVFQIARKTCRDIMMVDLSKTKSKWFGESEKQVKKIFDDYRKYYNYCKVKPILFINEADGIFSKRMSITGKSSSVEQTVNTIQNIILQELESFEGILFATTNLTENLDSAFERRFLFKIEFKSPLPEIREKIWKTKIPDLKSANLKELAIKYQLSGGEIENVARKCLVEKIIDGNQISLRRLSEFCELEKPFQKQNKIGFRNT